MIYSYRRNLICAVSMIVIILLGFCASVTLYSFDRTVILDTETGGTSCFYTFRENSLLLHLPESVPAEEAEWYCLNAEQQSFRAEGGAYENCAAFLAVLPTVQADGKTVYQYAKAITDAGSGHYAWENAFDLENVPFEVVMNAKEITKEEDITVWFGGEPMADTDVRLTSVKGERTVTTDQNGTIKFRSLEELSSGITVVYETETERYVFSLIAQHSEKTFYGFRKALLPVFLMIGLSVFGILVILLIRKILLRNKESYDIHALGTWNRPKDIFWRIREIVQFVFFVLTFFGSYLFGFKLSNSEIPVFVCGWNTNQFIQCGSCYYISHISYWLSDFDNSAEMFQGFINQMNWSLKDMMLWGTGWFMGTVILVLLFGRALCGFLCPFGFIQEKLNDLRQALHIREIRFSEKGYRILKMIQIEMLALFVGLGFFGIDYCHFCPASVVTSPAFAGFRINVYISVITASLAVIGSFFKERFFCNICPLGFLVGLFHKFCPIKIKKSGTACTECGGCYDACPVGIKSIYTEHEKEDLTCGDCVMCGKCVSQCPCSGALRITVFGKTIYESSAESFLKRQMKKSIKKSEKK